VRLDRRQRHARFPRDGGEVGYLAGCVGREAEEVHERAPVFDQSLPPDLLLQMNRDERFQDCSPVFVAQQGNARQFAEGQTLLNVGNWEKIMRRGNRCQFNQRRQ